MEGKYSRWDKIRRRALVGIATGVLSTTPGDTQQGVSHHSISQHNNHHNTLIIPTLNKDKTNTRTDLLSYTQEKLKEYKKIQSLLPTTDTQYKNENNTPDLMLSKETKLKIEKNIEEQKNIKEIIKGLEYLHFITGEAMNIINNMLKDPERLKNSKSVEYYKELEDKTNQRFFQELMRNIIIIEALKEKKGERFFNASSTQDERLELLAKTLREITQDPTIKISNKGATGITQIQGTMYRRVTGRIGQPSYFDISDNRFLLNMKYDFPINQKQSAGLGDPIISSVIAILLNYMNYKDIKSQFKSKITMTLKKDISNQEKSRQQQSSTQPTPNNTPKPADTGIQEIPKETPENTEQTQDTPQDTGQDTSQDISQDTGQVEQSTQVQDNKVEDNKVQEKDDNQVQNIQDIENNLNVSDIQSATLKYVPLTKLQIEDKIKKTFNKLNLEGIKSPRDLYILLVANYNGSPYLLWNNMSDMTRQDLQNKKDIKSILEEFFSKTKGGAIHSGYVENAGYVSKYLAIGDLLNVIYEKKKIFTNKDSKK